MKHLSMNIFKDAYEEHDFDDIFELLGDVDDDEGRKRGRSTPGRSASIYCEC